MPFAPSSEPLPKRKRSGSRKHQIPRQRRTRIKHMQRFGRAFYSSARVRARFLFPARQSNTESFGIVLVLVQEFKHAQTGRTMTIPLQWSSLEGKGAPCTGGNRAQLRFRLQGVHWHGFPPQDLGWDHPETLPADPVTTIAGNQWFQRLKP